MISKKMRVNYHSQLTKINQIPAQQLTNQMHYQQAMAPVGLMVLAVSLAHRDSHQLATLVSRPYHRPAKMTANFTQSLA
ncbi:hypothetical protein HMPREF9104_00041 [Lentilactobacillus kisonensis F0435]|uniref:Uncharacterized protein n=1 Tax=Lentilactobacillus kisonensis F0435 TaxID=797516 RepID=H1LBT1_9LACO|nr:hypothetical protein HMPREF9104_00041 [Lentilactobacillus kisonensis F0435]